MSARSQQSTPVLARVGEQRAATGVHDHLPGPHLDGLGDDLPDPGNRRSSASWSWALGQRMAELVPADPPHHVELPHREPQSAGHLDQDLVAGGMPVLVVDLLEIVEIHEHETVATHARRNLRQPVEHGPAVGKTGQLVMVRFVSQPVHGPGDGGDVPHRQDRPRKETVGGAASAEAFARTTRRGPLAGANT